MRTFISWQGNKSRFVNLIISELPEEYNTYIEPFLGSGALFLKLQPDNYIINDINKDLINVWKTVKNEPDKIKTYFKNFRKKFVKLPKEQKVELCKKLTKKLDIIDFDYKRARIFLLMKYCSYMGHIIKNNKFVFHGLNPNIYVNNQYYFLSEKYYELLENISNYLNENTGKIYNKDYVQILNKAKTNDFVFLDPPYVEEKKYQFNYNADEKISLHFLQELLIQVLKLDKKKVKWMMTQADTKEVKKVFKNYKIIEYSVYRSVSKTYINELLIKNY
jgi:DNA adenine methylase